MAAPRCGCGSYEITTGYGLGDADLWGDALLRESSGITFAPALLVDGQVEIVSQKSDPDADPCEGVYRSQDGPAYQIDWDVTFEGKDAEGEYRYEATGRDTIQFSTFFSESCTSDP